MHIVNLRRDVIVLRQSRQFQKVGIPEIVVLILVGAALVTTTLWWRGNGQSTYRETEGRVVNGEIQWVHYNATDAQRIVSLTYQYTVGTTSYTGTWAGLWPEDQSPNALSSSKLDLLRTKDYPLRVFYDPVDPAQSFLHVVSGAEDQVYKGLAISACVAALAYCAGVYPAWKARM